MRAGILRHRVDLQTNTPTRDAFGAEVAAWSTVATVWAAVSPVSGREFIEAKARAVDVTTRITIRYRPDVLPSPTNWRVLFGARVFDIDSVINRDERGMTIDLMCREVI